MVLGDVLDEGQVAFEVDLPVLRNHVLHQLLIFSLPHLDPAVDLGFGRIRTHEFKLQLFFSSADG